MFERNLVQLLQNALLSPQPGYSVTMIRPLFRSLTLAGKLSLASFSTPVLALRTYTDYRTRFVPIQTTTSGSAYNNNMVAATGPTAVPALTAVPTAANAPNTGGPAAAVPAERIQIVVVGAHLSGLPLNWQLTERNAELVKTTRTYPGKYRLYAFDGLTPPKPGLIEVLPSKQPEGEEWSTIEVEVWEMDVAKFGSFVKLIPPPLTMGHIRLEDGSLLHGFRSDEFSVQQLQGRDVTKFGGWRGYMAEKEGESTQLAAVSRM